MHRLVIDTNVYISGTFWTGLPYQLLRIASRKKFVTLVSQGILDEITDYTFLPVGGTAILAVV